MIVAIYSSQQDIESRLTTSRHTHRHQTTPSDTSQRTHDIEEYHIMCQCTSQTTSHECNCRGKETGTSTKDIRESSIQWLEGGTRNQVGGRQPRRGVGSVELRTDDGVSRCSDCAIET